MTPSELSESCDYIVSALENAQILLANEKQYEDIHSNMKDVKKALEKYKAVLLKAPQKSDGARKEIEKQTTRLLKTVKATDQKIRTDSSGAGDDLLGAIIDKGARKSFQIATAGILDAAKQLTLLVNKKAGVSDDSAKTKAIEQFYEERKKQLETATGIADDLKLFLEIFGKELKKILDSEFLPESHIKKIKKQTTAADLEKYRDLWIRLDLEILINAQKELKEIESEFANLENIETSKKTISSIAQANKSVNERLRMLIQDEALFKQVRQTDSKTAADIAKACVRFEKYVSAISSVSADIKTAREFVEKGKKNHGLISAEYSKHLKLIKSGAFNKTPDEKLKEMEEKAAKKKSAASMEKKIKKSISTYLDQLKEDTSAVGKLAATLKDHIKETVNCGGVTTARQITDALASKDPEDAVDAMIDGMAARRKAIEKRRLSKINSELQYKIIAIRNGKAYNDIGEVTALISRDITADKDAIPSLANIRSVIAPYFNQYQNACQGFETALKMLSTNISQEDDDIKKSMKLLEKAAKDAKRKKK